MKTKWIKCSERMPELEYIGENWDMSMTVLIYDADRNMVSIDNWNYNRSFTNQPGWLESASPSITCWQPIEYPESYDE